VDALNLVANRFETVSLERLLRESGTDYPALEQVFSILSDGTLRRPVRIMLDVGRDALVADFGGLLENPTFVNRIATILRVLEEVLHTPVDIEFAHDGHDFYLLQCRPQSASDDDAPAPIPRGIPETDVVFRATRYVSNGRVPDLTHVVYVDPERYAALPERSDYLEVAATVSELNKLLPKRQFVLMGPGRWGSKGDVRLGVGVGYSDLNNTAMLIEIARDTGGYRPDLSFGTHFFQDLVESRIRYLPLYLDDGSGTLADDYLRGSPNLLSALLPDRSHLADVVHVVDVPSTSGGRVLRVLLNSDLDVGLGVLAAPGSGDDPDVARLGSGVAGTASESHWTWRTRMAERLAASLDVQRFGVVGLYLIGSTKNATAGPASDIDLLVHVRADDAQRRQLEAWLDGWSRSLAETNYLRTGHELPGLLDVHFITDDDIARRTSFAAKIGAVTDPARELQLTDTATDAPM
jgi:predicted nucleotidyltransferase